MNNRHESYVAGLGFELEISWSAEHLDDLYHLNRFLFIVLCTTIFLMQWCIAFPTRMHVCTAQADQSFLQSAWRRFKSLATLSLSWTDSDCADVQADLRLHWALMYFVKITGIDWLGNLLLEELQITNISSHWEWAGAFSGTNNSVKRRLSGPKAHVILIFHVNLLARRIKVVYYASLIYISSGRMLIGRQYVTCRVIFCPAIVYHCPVK